MFHNSHGHTSITSDATQLDLHMIPPEILKYLLTFLSPDSELFMHLSNCLFYVDYFGPFLIHCLINLFLMLYGQLPFPLDCLYADPDRKVQYL